MRLATDNTPHGLLQRMLMLDALKNFTAEEVYKYRPDAVEIFDDGEVTSTAKEYSDLFINWEFCIFELPNAEFNFLLVNLHKDRSQEKIQNE